MNYSTPTTTSDSNEEGRLKVDVSSKKKLLKSILRKQYK